MTTKLATVDISSLFRADAPAPERARCQSELHSAFTTAGFAILRGTGVPAATLQAMRDAVCAVFAVPRATYRAQRVRKDNYRGYVPLGFFTPNAGGSQADQYEAWKLHWEVEADDPVRTESDLYGPNRWPAIAYDVKSAVLAYWKEMDRVNHAVLAALCQAMGLDADGVLSGLQQPLTNMTLLNYPPCAPGDARWGIHPHKDFNYLTLLAHDPVGGLQVRNRQGGWMDAACAPQEYVMNVGDMLELLSGGRLVSTPHRVTNQSGRARQSFPYFSVPRHNVRIAPLLPPVPGFDRAALEAGSASRAIWYSNWPDVSVQDAAIDLGDYA